MNKNKSRTQKSHKNILFQYNRDSIKALVSPVDETELLGINPQVRFIDFYESINMEVNYYSIFNIGSDDDDENDFKMFAADETYNNAKNDIELSELDEDDNTNNNSDIINIDNFAEFDNDLNLSSDFSSISDT